MTVSVPVVFPTAPRTIQILGGENLFRIAEQELGDATQWWRITLLNAFPGEEPDFILSAEDAQRLGGVLQIPPNNPNAAWP
jgi:hypothetical protein